MRASKQSRVVSSDDGVNALIGFAVVPWVRASIHASLVPGVFARTSCGADREILSTVSRRLANDYGGGRRVVISCR